MPTLECVTNEEKIVDCNTDCGPSDISMLSCGPDDYVCGPTIDDEDRGFGL